MTIKKMYHNAVLLEESIDRKKKKKNGVYVDLTFGGGGHSKEILKRLNKEGKIIAFDNDEDALQNQINDSRFIFLRQNFIYLMQNLSFFKIKKIDGLIADLGVSSHQFDIKERGFSYEGDNELDMRMDVNQNINAIKIVNTYSEQKLADLFFYNGDLTNSRRISKLICDYRKNIEIKNSNQLNDSLKPILNKGYENKFLARIYQSLRIEVNDEIGCLKKLLNQIPKVLKPNGIASIITYHSIEDRLVKRFFKNGNFNKEPEKDEFGNIKTIFKIKKFIKPNDLEIKENPRSRSAKLRVAKLI